MPKQDQEIRTLQKARNLLAAGATTPARREHVRKLDDRIAAAVTREMDDLRTAQKVTAAKVEAALAKLDAALARAEAGGSNARMRMVTR